MTPPPVASSRDRSAKARSAVSRGSRRIDHFLWVRRHLKATGGAKLDRRLEVGAHAHAQIGEAELRGELGKKREMQPRRLFEGWNAHQASDLERELFATEAQQTRCLFREHAGFLWFLARIDLDEKLKAAS